MTRLGIAACVLLLGGCAGDLQTKDAVRQAVIDHLSARKGLDLDLSAMVVDVTSVMFRADEAEATVAFRPRGGSASGGDMQMRYTLARNGSRWVVKSKAGGEHGAASPPPAASGGELPPGHPPMSGGKR